VGHTGIYAFGDCVRRVDLGQLATVVELRIPCVYTWGVSRIVMVCVHEISTFFRKDVEDIAPRQN
jgi:hypothetical protein